MAARALTADKLENRYQTFVLALIEKNFVASVAILAISPKLSAKSAGVEGSKLLAVPRVQALLTEELIKIRNVQRFGLLEITEEMRRMAFSNMQDFLTVSSDGEAYIDLSEAIKDRAKMAAVQSVETIEEPVFKEGEEVGTRRRIRLRMHAKEPSLDKLARIFGAYDGKEPPQVHNHVTNIDARQQTIIVTPDDAAKRYRELMGRK